VGSKTLANELALRIGNRQRILLGYDPVPKCCDVAELLVRREIVEPGRRNRNSECHETSIASENAARNGAAASTLVLRVRLTAWRSAASARNNFIRYYHFIRRAGCTEGIVRCSVQKPARGTEGINRLVGGARLLQRPVSQHL
jgi:hypothetical protein